MAEVIEVFKTPLRVRALKTFKEKYGGKKDGGPAGGAPESREHLVGTTFLVYGQAGSWYEVEPDPSPHDPNWSNRRWILKEWVVVVGPEDPVIVQPPASTPGTLIVEIRLPKRVEDALVKFLEKL